MTTRESLARALCSAYGTCCGDECEMGDCIQLKAATSALNALTAQGLAIVPIEPTEEMLNALNDQLGHGDNELIPAYKAMLKASEET